MRVGGKEAMSMMTKICIPDIEERVYVFAPKGLGDIRKKLIYHFVWYVL